jgi:antitoxin ParD1/3/4
VEHPGCVPRAGRLKLKVLRKQIKAGAEALDRGDFTEVDEAELDAYLQELSVGNSRDG